MRLRVMRAPTTSWWWKVTPPSTKARVLGLPTSWKSAARRSRRSGPVLSTTARVWASTSLCRWIGSCSRARPGSSGRNSSARPVRTTNHRATEGTGTVTILSSSSRSRSAETMASRAWPLRMLRAARFIARLELEPAPELVDAVRSGHARLAIVSAERLRDELDKIVTVPVPSVALWFVVRTGLADEFLPELPGLALEQDPIHRHKDVLAHTLAVVDKTGNDRLLRLAALFHDVGKPKTRAFVDGGVTFHHHEVAGARMTRQRMLALKYPKDEVEMVTELVNLHLRFHTYRLGWTDRAVRRYVRDAGPLLDRLNELTRCDCTTRNAAKAKALGRRMDELELRIDELRQEEELDAIRPDLDGAQVMEQLGLPPGRDVGRALAFLLELRMDEGPLGEAEAHKRLAAWWEDASGT